MYEKNISLLVLACFAVLFSACHKEGVYNPSKKISKIYHTNSDGVKSIDEVWTWNKNNTLEKIDFYMSNSIYRTYNFTYDNKRLVKLSYSSKYYVEYKYDGNKLKEANCYEYNKLCAIYTFTYKNGKISKIEEKWLDYDKSSEKRYNTVALDFILPREFNEAVMQYNKRKEKSGGMEVITYSLTWEKGNITKALITEIDEEYEEYTLECKYDNKKNPFLGFSGEDMSSIVYSGYRSQNNIVERTERWNNGSDYYKVTYDYTYEGQYPVSYRKSFTEGGNGGSYSGYSGMTEYEYTK